MFLHGKDQLILMAGRWNRVECLPCYLIPEPFFSFIIHTWPLQSFKFAYPKLSSLLPFLSLFIAPVHLPSCFLSFSPVRAFSALFKSYFLFACLCVCVIRVTHTFAKNWVTYTSCTELIIPSAIFIHSANFWRPQAICQALWTSLGLYWQVKQLWLYHLYRGCVSSVIWSCYFEALW
jgi:hypothetical protein